MAMNMTSGSQPSILYGFGTTISGGTTFTLTDSSGQTIMTGTPSKNYASIVLSSPELKSGETYTITAGGQSAQFTLSGTTYSNVSGGMGGGGGASSQGGQGGPSRG